MAGTLDLVQRGLTGLETREDALWLDPVPLPEPSSYGFALRHQGHRGGVRLRLERGQSEIAVPSSDRSPSTYGCRAAPCASNRGRRGRWCSPTDPHGPDGPPGKPWWPLPGGTVWRKAGHERQCARGRGHAMACPCGHV